VIIDDSSSWRTSSWIKALILDFHFVPDADAKCSSRSPRHQLILLFARGVIPCLAQTEDAAISGRVIDQTGAVVAGATVQLRSAERGTLQETTTNASGVYVFPSVQPGVYHITVRKEGFQSENVRPA
jgi:protocatechuate 3,4-dioxygenase beta subunit